LNHPASASALTLLTDQLEGHEACEKQSIVEVHLWGSGQTQSNSETVGWTNQKVSIAVVLQYNTISANFIKERNRRA